MRVAAFLDEVRAGTEAPERIEEVLREALHDPTLELLLYLPASGSTPTCGTGRRGRPPPAVGADRPARPARRRVGISLRVIEARMRAAGRSDEAQRLDRAVGDLAATIAQLRDLAHRLPPAQLDEGIGAAFAELAERAPLLVAVDARLERLDRAIEATAYFVGVRGAHQRH